MPESTPHIGLKFALGAGPTAYDQDTSQAPPSVAHPCGTHAGEHLTHVGIPLPCPFVHPAEVTMNLVHEGCAGLDAHKKTVVLSSTHLML